MESSPPDPDSSIESWTVPEELAGMRVDRALALLAPSMSRSSARAVIEAGHVTLAGCSVSGPRQVVSAGEVITTDYLPELEPQDLVPQPMPLDIVAEQEGFIVVNKPPGLVMHPSRGHREGTIANGLAAHSETAACLPRAGIVHRLDKDTSGLFVAAKTEAARLALIEQFKERTANRSYYAIVHGQPNQTGVIDLAIGRDATSRIKMAVSQTGRSAVTRWQVVATGTAYSLLICELESGRTHQIRVHMERLGHPIAGDRTYHRHARAEGEMFARQMLHAYKLSINDPMTDEPLEFSCPPPADFVAAQVALELEHT